MTHSIRPPLPHILEAGDNGAAEAAFFNAPFGLFGRRKIRAMAGRKLIRCAPALEDGQFQPASLDLRLGKEAYRVRASFLPGRGRTVKEHLESLDAERISLSGEGAVLERGIVYVARLAESLALLPSISGAANPKSSTGRLDIFTRLIVDGAEAFDAAPLGYRGELWLEISPRSFSVRVHEGSRLNQIRFRSRNSQQMDKHDFTLPDDDLQKRHLANPLVDGELTAREGALLRVDLGGAGDAIVGYRAIKNSSVIDVNKVAGYAAEDFWEPIAARPDRRLILDPEQFYILASREKVQIPADLAAEMAPIDPAIGEFRVHYAGFFDPGFGHGADGRPSARAVLEVRSRDVPFLLEDGQPVGRLVYEALGDAPEPEELYGAGATSNYQGQGLKLAKHFRPFAKA
ncbi:MAG: 2'-deoxycytidine 5'-triphosphate deaminase [Bradyrhizobium sp.]|nr:MAG: 2'-deoxycytidine 5'-triphosphate deaminase [Bradyrhizobium sp.]